VRNNGGPAFPVQGVNVEGMSIVHSSGMTLRDWFAGKALAGFMANPKVDSNTLATMPNGDEVVAKYIFKLADAMLTERAKEVKL
jgi:hypothetical protein